MRCSACSTENPPQAKFCQECAVPLARRCPFCGTALSEAAKFCVECAQPVSAPGATPGPSPSPQVNTPKHLADRILASREALEGERKQVTVLFADVVGSTELIRDLDPEDARTLLEPAVSAMIEAVHRFEGTVCRVMGDGIMALFGAPLAHEDHAARACYAALTMQHAIRVYGDAARARAGVEVLARVGLNSGEVVVGAISNDLYVEYSAIGPTTHLAARMEQLAVPGTVRLTAETLRLVDGLVDVRSLGKIPVKGLPEPVEAFELIGVGASRRRFQAATARGLTPLVGRQAELDALQRALDLARSRHGQVVAPVGEPGVGKSRLLYEFVHSHRTRDWLVVESGSVSYGKATSYLPVIDLLKGYCRIEPRDDARTVREKLTGKLLALDPALAAILPTLLALLDLPVEDSSASSGHAAWSTLDPAGRRRATLDALRRLLLRESQEQPLLLVFEDLHWIDSETQALLDSLVEALPTARVLLLVNYRPEYTHTWGNKSYYTQLRIDPLGQASAEELLTALLGNDPGVEPLKALLIGRTEGNPFFLEESARALVETGALVGERGGYRLAGPVEDVRVPATVQAVLAARIDRLPPEDKRLLQTVAVIGKDVSFALLQRIAQTPDAELQAGLSRLQAAELLYVVSLFPELELTFKHALTHEVAYGSLLQDRRRVLHARIVEASEALYADRLDEQIERLAHHALRGSVWEKALAYCREAGGRAIGRSAGREAVGYLEGALTAVGHLPQDRERIEQAIDIRFDLRTALATVDEHQRIYQYLREAETLAHSIGDQRRLGWVTAYLAHYMRATVDHQQAVALGEQAVAVAATMGDRNLHVIATQVIAQSSHELGRYQDVVDLVRTEIDSLTGTSDYQRERQHIAAAVSFRSVIALCLSWQGNFREALEHTSIALAIAETTGHPLTKASANVQHGLMNALAGNVSLAILHLEQAIDSAYEFGNGPHPSWRAFLGYAYTLAQRADEAVDQLEQSLTGAAKIHHFACVSLWTEWLAGAYVLAGRQADAQRTASQALEIAEKYRERGFAGYALRQLGEVAAHAGVPDPEVAETFYRRALVVAEDLGMRPLQAHCHLSFGKLYRRSGRPYEARAALNVAIDLYLSMEMRHWVPEAEAELAQATAAMSGEPVR